MKMNQNHNLFSFLSRGVTTTHPWCSVFILCLCFVFCADLVSASASQSNIPEMTDWQFAQAIDAYAGLTDDQKDIANFLTGSQGYAFAGIAQSNLNTSFSSYDDAINSVKNFGAKIWDELTNIDKSVESAIYRRRETLQGIKNDLSNFLGNSVTYAKSRSESFSAWLGNVGIDYNSSSEFRVQFGKDQAQDNVDYFGDQGLYRWQFSSNVITPEEYTFTWLTRTLSGNYAQSYYGFLNQMSGKIIQVNRTESGRGWYNNYISSIELETYCYIFANTTNNTCYLCDKYGNQAPSSFSVQYLNSEHVSTTYINFTSTTMSPQVINLNNYSSLQSLFDAINSNKNLILRNTIFIDYDFPNYIEGMYIGSSWSDKAPWTRDFDLNLTPTSQYVTINAPTNVIYIDLNGFMRDLYDNPTIIYNYVVNNSIDGNGDPVDGGDFKPTSNIPAIPSSGINIGLDFFKVDGVNNLFGSNGYIMTLWNNTKGLVLYIGSIFEVLTIDNSGGFAYIIYGAVSMGVIGGIFSKFLL